jgi:hypothetical protein
MGQHFSDKGLDPGIDRNRAQMLEESAGDSQPVKILLDDALAMKSSAIS